MNAMGQEIPFTASTRFEWICGNRYLLERTTETPKGMPMTFEYLTIMQATGDGTYKLWFFDQMGTTVEGAGKADGDAIHWEIDMPMGKGRSTLAVGEDGSMTSEGEQQLPGSDEWVKSRSTKGTKRAAK